MTSPDGGCDQTKGTFTAVTNLYWQSHAMLTFPQVSKIIIDLIDRPTMPPSGWESPPRPCSRRPSRMQ